MIGKLFNGRSGGLLTFGLGDKQKAFRFIDSLKLAKNLANLGDAKTLVIHPSSTIFHEFNIAEQNKMGVCEDMVRVSVGIEDFEDIRKDFEQAIERALEVKE
jgi:O-acetylhomoserine (thiol)-lyase